jgi:hypothetical protein
MATVVMSRMSAVTERDPEHRSMFDTTAAALVFGAIVAVLSLLGLLADEWGADSRDGFADPTSRLGHH